MEWPEHRIRVGQTGAGICSCSSQDARPRVNDLTSLSSVPWVTEADFRALLQLCEMARSGKFKVYVPFPTPPPTALPHFPWL